MSVELNYADLILYFFLAFFLACVQSNPLMDPVSGGKADQAQRERTGPGGAGGQAGVLRLRLRLVAHDCPFPSLLLPFFHPYITSFLICPCCLFYGPTSRTFTRSSGNICTFEFGFSSTDLHSRLGHVPRRGNQPPNAIELGYRLILYKDVMKMMLQQLTWGCQSQVCGK